MIDELKPYAHIPSMSTIAIGVSVGIARIGFSKAINPLLFSVAPAHTLTAGTLAFTYDCSRMFYSIIIAPLLEEWIFRRNLKDATFTAICKNSFAFGLIHSLNPGPLEYKVGRIVSSTFGGFFYCGAKLASDDLWASTIAHSIHNINAFLN